MMSVSDPSQRRRLVLLLMGLLLCSEWDSLPSFAQTKSKSPDIKRESSSSRPLGNWKTGDELYQLITVTKRPVFKIQGLPFQSEIQYKILSKLSLRRSEFDDSLTIQQKVETTKLEQADELSKAVLTQMLKDLTGKTLTIRLNADGEVTRVEGVPEPMAAGAVNNGLDFRGAMLSSLIDRDGWKELTRATFFVPPQPLVPNATWEEPFSHHWGDLGAWKGTAVYRVLAPRGELQPIGYDLNLNYVPPQAGQNNLPFKIANPAFQTKESKGTLLYDPAKGRLSVMEETFHVTGRLTIQVAGQNLPMELDESQRFKLELFDQKPAPEKR